MLPKTNTAYEQYKLFERVQTENEPFNEFYIDLLNIAHKCDFGDQLNTILKARIVFGINNKVLRERLLRNPDLSLTEVVNYCRASEDAKIKNSEIECRSNGNTGEPSDAVQALTFQDRSRVSHGRNQSTWQKSTRGNQPAWQKSFHGQTQSHGKPWSYNSTASARPNASNQCILALHEDQVDSITRGMHNSLSIKMKCIHVAGVKLIIHGDNVQRMGSSASTVMA